LRVELVDMPDSCLPCQESRCRVVTTIVAVQHLEMLMQSLMTLSWQLVIYRHASAFGKTIPVHLTGSHRP
jgi:hypothetical protein